MFPIILLDTTITFPIKIYFLELNVGSLIQANVHPDMQEEISGAILSSPIPRNIFQLRPMVVVWTAYGASK